MDHARTIPNGVGLGCSRFGSIVNGVSDSDADRLVAAALEAGVVHFDTADIYGQGDSERMLGRRLRPHRSRVVVATKVGQQFPLLQRLLRPLKRPLAALVSAKPGARAQLQQVRARSLPRSYEPAYLRSAVTASLRRLGLERVDVVYLHSPAVSDLGDGLAVGCLEGLREQGLLSSVGVSCDDLETARQALADSRVSVLQVPFMPDEPSWTDLLTSAERGRVAVVVRSIFGGPGSPLDEGARQAIVARAAGDKRIRSVLVGTSKTHHLAQIATWAREAAQADGQFRAT